MAVLPVVKYGDPVLRKKVNPVTEFYNLETLIDDIASHVKQTFLPKSGRFI